jgi:hypothetical protein
MKQTHFECNERPDNFIGDRERLNSLLTPEKITELTLVKRSTHVISFPFCIIKSIPKIFLMHL